MKKNPILFSSIIGAVIGVIGFALSLWWANSGALDPNVMAVAGLWLGVGLLVARGIYVGITPKPDEPQSSF